MKVTVESHINIQKNLAKVHSKELWSFAINEWYKLVSPYVPMQTGALSTTTDIKVPKGKVLSSTEIENKAKLSGNIKGEDMGGSIEYIAPHAHYIYEGRLMVDPDTGSPWAEEGAKKVYADKNLNYQTDKHDLASAHWDKAAEPSQKPKLIQAMQKFVDRGGLGLSE